MSFRSLVRSCAFGVAIAVASAAVPAAGAGSELTAAEMVALDAGHPVVREETVERDGHRYIGGVGYILIDAAPAAVAKALDDVKAYKAILPSTRSVRWIGISRKGDTLVELEQGNALAHGKYTVRVRRDRRADDDASTFRFAIDPRFSHDIPDANGMFHIEARGERTLLTYLVLVDLGDGILRRLFEGRVRKVALSAPQLVKNYVEAQRPTDR
jgi:carbon monoxide dehydrogenase subunit G